MKKSAIALFSIVALCAASTSFAAGPLRISAVYGGGGAAAGSPATYNQDYVEIFNNSGAAIDLSNYTIQYGSAAGNWGSSAGNIFTFPGGTFIQPCKYILVAFGTPSAGGGPLSVLPDFTGTLSIGAVDGKVALFSAVNANLACGSELPGTLVDKVAFGTGNCPEGAAVAALTNQHAAERQAAGTVDTDSNSADFVRVMTPTPRNSASPANTLCLATPASPSSWGTVKNIYR